MQNKSNYK